MPRRPDPRQASLADLLDLTLAPAPDVSAAEALVAAGIVASYHQALSGALNDPGASYFPRSLAFPVTLSKPWFETTERLFFSTPACTDIPFVHRVEAVTGLRAVWDPRVSYGQWHQAVDLADDRQWRRLAASMAHTTVESVERAVALKLTWGELSLANARALLAAIGSVEPEGRSEIEWDGVTPSPSGGITCFPHGGWWAVHGLEDGWYKPRKGDKGEKLTAAGLARIRRTHQAAKGERVRTEAA